ncbi:MAG: hypothetical protein P1P65_00880 [Treponema sp.]
MKKKKPEYLYSIAQGGVAILNADQSVPAPDDWEDENQTTGEKRKHKGGLVGKPGPFNLDGWVGDDLKLGIIYGKKTATVNVVLTAVDKKAVTATEIVKDLNTAFGTLTASDIKLKAIKTTKGADYDAEYIKITDAETVNPLPHFAPFGIRGKLADLIGLIGWVETEEMKSVKGDFEKEAGKSVDATSGLGIRCSIKEPDTIKGVNLTLSLAAIDDSLLALITGSTYNEKTGELYFDKTGDPPLVAVRYFVQQYEGGGNEKGNFVKMKMVLYPSCSFSAPNEEAKESDMNTAELQGSGSENKRSNLPMKCTKTISRHEFSQFVA